MWSDLPVGMQRQIMSVFVRRRAEGKTAAGFSPTGMIIADLEVQAGLAAGRDRGAG